LLNDPEFQSLDVATQKSTLGKLDTDFTSLSDADYQKFRDGLTAPKAPARQYKGMGAKDVAGMTSEDALAQSPFLQRSGAAMEGLRKGKLKDFAGNLGAAGYELIKPEVETASMIGGGEAVVGAGKALAAGAARPAAALAGSLATGYVTDKALRSLGAPPWLAEMAAVGAGLKVGSKLSPATAAKIEETLKSGGVKGVIKKWLQDAAETETVPPMPKEAPKYAPSIPQAKPKPPEAPQPPQKPVYAPSVPQAAKPLTAPPTTATATGAQSTAIPKGAQIEDLRKPVGKAPSVSPSGKLTGPSAAKPSNVTPITTKATGNAPLMDKVQGIAQGIAKENITGEQFLKLPFEKQQSLIHKYDALRQPVTKEMIPLYAKLIDMHAAVK
jgi:hypothetical protein